MTARMLAPAVVAELQRLARTDPPAFADALERVAGMGHAVEIPKLARFGSALQRIANNPDRYGKDAAAEAALALGGLSDEPTEGAAEPPHPAPTNRRARTKRSRHG